jgi:hypothetical protein
MPTHLDGWYIGAGTTNALIHTTEDHLENYHMTACEDHMTIHNFNKNNKILCTKSAIG